MMNIKAVAKRKKSVELNNYSDIILVPPQRKKYVLTSRLQLDAQDHKNLQ